MVGAAAGDFAVPVARVLEILPVSALDASVSQEPWHRSYGVCGLVRTHGRRVPVVDLSQRLGGEATPVGTQRILLTESKRRTFGLRVDRVEDLLAVPKEAVRALPAYLRTVGNEYLAGLLNRETGWLILLDLDRMMLAPSPKASDS